MASQPQQSLALKIFAITTSLIGFGIFAYVQLKPVLSGVDSENPGPIIAVAVVAIALVSVAAWRYIVRKRELGGRIRRRSE